MLRNAGAGVSHLQFSGTCGVAQLDSDSFLEGELESIGYKVEDNLFHVRCGSPRCAAIHGPIRA